MLQEDTKTQLDIESDVAALLERKKQEIVASLGAIQGTKEAITAHDRHISSLRTEFQELIKAGSLTLEAANVILSYVNRSSKILLECHANFKSIHDIRTGEALAYDGLIKKMKMSKTTFSTDEETLADSSLPDPLNVISNSNAEEKTPNKRGRQPKSKKEVPAAEVKSRPDARGRVGDTVKRMKEARQNKVSSS